MGVYEKSVHECKHFIVDVGVLRLFRLGTGIVRGLLLFTVFSN